MLTRIWGSVSAIAKLARLFAEFAVDAGIFVHHNGYSPFQSSRRKIYYRLVIESHAIEKALTLGAPRPLFGRKKIDVIVRMLDGYDPQYSSLPAEMALGALLKYIEFHHANQIQDKYLDQLSAFCTRYSDRYGLKPSGGTKRPTPPIQVQERDACARFLQSRSSHRRYTKALLQEDVVARVVRVAQSAPSQCNRQATKVYFYQDHEWIVQLLALQAGAAGFDKEVPNLFILTSDIAAWGGGRQRNQLYIDGGLFAMQLLLACHSEGVATCPLNLATWNRVEADIKRLAKIPKGERLIMMIAAGYASGEGATVACSPRRPLEEVLINVAPGATVTSREAALV
jgi:nitroreductase